MTTFRWLTVGGLFMAVVAVGAVGCDRPEISKDELGTIVTEYPDLPNRAEVLPIPDEADAKCPFQKKKRMMEQLSNTMATAEGANSAETATETAETAAETPETSETPAPAEMAAETAETSETPAAAEQTDTAEVAPTEQPKSE